MSEAYLAEAKERALRVLGNDGPTAAAMALIAALRAHEAFRGKGQFLALLEMDVRHAVVPKGSAGVRAWIEGLGWPSEIPSVVILSPSDSRVTSGSA